MRLTRDEIILVTGLLITLVIGAVVKNYRAERREAAVAVTATAEGGARTTSKR